VSEDAQQYLSAEWVRENVSSVGPVGRAYRVWGDGQQMASGFDDEDYFGVPNATMQSLASTGYKVWAPVRPAGSWISEGDTSNFAMHVDNGLRNAEHPSFGGWGGRQQLDENDPSRWNSVGLAPWTPGAPIVDAGDVARWFGAFQRDLAARLQWTVTANPRGANHAPRIAAVDLDRVVRPGDDVQLSYTVSDPDDDVVVVSAWQDRGPACVLSVSSEGCHVSVPADTTAGAEIHIIIEAVDDGTPALTGYARFTLTVV
jgi:hypothetical protein